MKNFDEIITIELVSSAGTFNRTLIGRSIGRLDVPRRRNAADYRWPSVLVRFDRLNPADTIFPRTAEKAIKEGGQFILVENYKDLGVRV